MTRSLCESLQSQLSAWADAAALGGDSETTALRSALEAAERDAADARTKLASAAERGARSPTLFRPCPCCGVGRSKRFPLFSCAHTMPAWIHAGWTKARHVLTPAATRVTQASPSQERNRGLPRSSLQPTRPSRQSPPGLPPLRRLARLLGPCWRQSDAALASRGCAARNLLAAPSLTALAPFCACGVLGFFP